MGQAENLGYILIERKRMALGARIRPGRPIQHRQFVIEIAVTLRR